MGIKLEPPLMQHQRRAGYPRCGPFKIWKRGASVNYAGPRASVRGERAGPQARYHRGMVRDFRYSIVDVFADEPLQGNPLAIFHDGRGLSADQMQALARETNLSETTFVLPADDAEEDRREGVRVRIFTTEEELPFAGHPTLGTASWLRAQPGPVRGAETVVLRLKSGAIPVRFDTEAAGDERAGDGLRMHGSGFSGSEFSGSEFSGSERYSLGIYGSMRQADPAFGVVYPANEIAAVLALPE